MSFNHIVLPIPILYIFQTSAYTNTAFGNRFNFNEFL